MLVKFYETEKFKRLENEWYEKLSSEGFQDVEKRVGEALELRQFSGKPYYQNSDCQRFAKEKYFELIRECWELENFHNQMHAWIMQKIAEGQTAAEVYRELRLNKTKITYRTVRYLVRRYEHKWRIRIYTWREMKLRPRPWWIPIL